MTGVPGSSCISTCIPLSQCFVCFYRAGLSGGVIGSSGRVASSKSCSRRMTGILGEADISTLKSYGRVTYVTAGGYNAVEIGNTKRIGTFIKKGVYIIPEAAIVIT